MPLNYNEVQSIYRREKNTPALQHVRDDFYQELQQFLSELGEEHRGYIGGLVDDIVEKRGNKVVMQALRTSDSPPINATPEEVKLYGKVVDLLARYRDGLGRAGVVEKSIVTPGKEVIEREDGMKSIRILRPIPAIIGVDSKHYGPFEENEEITIPSETADILVGKGIAEEV